MSEWVELALIICFLVFWIQGAYMSRYEIGMLMILAFLLAFALYTIGLAPR